MLFGLRRKPDELQVVLERNGPALLVSAVGSVDAHNLAVWRRLVGDAAGIATGPGPLIIDTSGLEFMAVCAFTALAEEAVRCRDRGIKLCLVSNQRVAQRAVTVIGLHAELSFFTSVDDVLNGSCGDPEAFSGPEYQR